MRPGAVSGGRREMVIGAASIREPVEGEQYPLAQTGAQVGVAIGWARLRQGTGRNRQRTSHQLSRRRL
jgi:hypothetical protein